MEKLKEKSWSRRSVLSASALALIAKPASARQLPSSFADVRDFGARGDGTRDDTAAFTAALAAAQCVDIPIGTFRIVKPLVLRDGQTLRGTGRSGWEPYTGKGAPASAVKTEILLDGALAFDVRNTNNATISGIAIRARDARQSGWGGRPGYQEGTTGINITGALQFEARDISFHGLEVGVSCIADSGQSAQMPRIGDWSAQDCGTVFRFISNDLNFYAARDARIDGCIAALHCGRIAEVRKCDGLRIENVRFFQCATNSLLIERTPFLAITGATLFETGEETIILRDCQYVTMAGVQIVRTGYYWNGRLVQRSGLLMENCQSIKFEGLVEQSVGRAITIRGCTNLSIAAVVGTPFWMTGSSGGSEGAIHIERSKSILVNASFSGVSYWVAVWADSASAPSVAGQITTEGFAGVVRCVQLQPTPLGHIAKARVAMAVKPGAAVSLDEVRLLVPAGKTLVSRSVELTMSGFAFAVGNLLWNEGNRAEPGGGVLSVERKIIHRNESAENRYVSVPMGLVNLTDRTQTVAPAAEIRLSLAFE
jgi:hypothetical protein